MNRVEVQLNMLVYWDRNKQDYVMMLGNLIPDHNDGRARRPGILFYRLLDTPYDRLPFVSSSWL